MNEREREREKKKKKLTEPRIRDDLTVEVIFFGDGADKSGNVTVNEEATATKKAEGEVKSKL